VYQNPLQGFFIKPDSDKDLKDLLKEIVDYWSKSYKPSDARHNKRLR
jgi:hypothetical protein